MALRGGLLAKSISLVLAVVCLGSLPGCFNAPPQIVKVDPDRGSVGVAANATITVRFDQDVDHASVEQRFSISPTLGCDLKAAFGKSPGSACYVQWLTGQPGFTLYHPGALFSPNTKYVFHLESGFSSASGTANSLSHDWDLTSAQAPLVSGSTPPDRANGITVDSALVVNFSRPMDPGSTAAAITLTPSVPGTRVVPNRKDPYRFVVIPGGLLRAGAAYQLRVWGSARGVDGQRLALPVIIRFTTGGISGLGHAVAVTQTPGRSGVDMISLTPGPAGDPALVQRLLTAPAGTEITAATLANGSTLLATVEKDLTAPGTPSHIAVYDVVSGKLRATIAGADDPGWSSDGWLAYRSPDGVGELRLGDPQTHTLKLATQPTAAPQWILNHELLTQTGAVVELVDVDAQTVSPLPGAPPISSFVTNAAGMVAAQTATTPSRLFVEDLGGAVLPPTLLAGVTPLGFLGADSVLGQTAAGLSRVSLSDFSQQPINGGPGQSQFASVQVVPGGRQLGWVQTGTADQVLACNSDGSGTALITNYPAGTKIVGVNFSG